MKVLAAPLNYSHKQEGQLDGLRAVLGAENVIEFDYWGPKAAKTKGNDQINAELIDLALTRKPDWIWLQIQGTQVIAPSALSLIKNELPRCVITHWMGDVRERVPESLAEICRVTDATLISSVGQIPLYQAVGAKRVEYVQIGLDYEADVLGEPPWDPPFEIPDVVFLGNYYANVFQQGTLERLDAIRALMEAEIPIGVVGAGWPDGIPVIGRCHVKQQHHVYKRAKVALSINHFNHIDRYYSDRHLIAMASGTPVVARYVPGLEREFVDGGECLFWDPGKTTLVDRVQYLLDHPNVAQAIGYAGRQQVVRNHTWENRFRVLLPKIKQWGAA